MLHLLKPPLSMVALRVGLIGWTSTGFVLVIDNTIGAAPTNGNFQAVLSTYPSTVSATSFGRIFRFELLVVLEWA